MRTADFADQRSPARSCPSLTRLLSLQPDYYRDAPHFRLVGAGPQYRLEIPYAKLDFTGTYSVIARNCHGEAKAVISLQIYAKGEPRTGEDSRASLQNFKLKSEIFLSQVKARRRTRKSLKGKVIARNMIRLYYF